MGVFATMIHTFITLLLVSQGWAQLVRTSNGNIVLEVPVVMDISCLLFDWSVGRQWIVWLGYHATDFPRKRALAPREPRPHQLISLQANGAQLTLSGGASCASPGTLASISDVNAAVSGAVAQTQPQVWPQMQG